MPALPSLLLIQQMSQARSVSTEKRKFWEKKILRETYMFPVFPAWVTYVTFSEGPQKPQINNHIPAGISKPT